MSCAVPSPSWRSLRRPCAQAKKVSSCSSSMGGSVASALARASTASRSATRILTSTFLDKAPSGARDALVVQHGREGVVEMVEQLAPLLVLRRLAKAFLVRG